MIALAHRLLDHSQRCRRMAALSPPHIAESLTRLADQYERQSKTAIEFAANASARAAEQVQAEQGLQFEGAQILPVRATINHGVKG